MRKHYYKYFQTKYINIYKYINLYQNIGKHCLHYMYIDCSGFLKKKLICFLFFGGGGVAYMLFRQFNFCCLLDKINDDVLPQYMFIWYIRSSNRHNWTTCLFCWKYVYYGSIFLPLHAIYKIISTCKIIFSTCRIVLMTFIIKIKQSVLKIEKLTY